MSRTYIKNSTKIYDILNSECVSFNGIKTNAGRVMGRGDKCGSIISMFSPFVDKSRDLNICKLDVCRSLPLECNSHGEFISLALKDLHFLGNLPKLKASSRKPMFLRKHV